MTSLANDAPLAAAMQAGALMIGGTAAAIIFAVICGFVFVVARHFRGLS